MDEAKFSAWLKEHKLENYISAFRDKGFDDFERFGMITDEHLIAMGVIPEDKSKFRAVFPEPIVKVSLLP